MKRLKKGQGVAWLVVLLACIVGFGYLAWNIVTATVSGKDDFDIRLGLDLAGGVSITYQVVGDTPSSEDLNDTVTKLQKRIENELGSDSSTTEASVYPVGDDRITVEIPGVKDANALLAELGTPGSIYFIAQTDADGNQNYSYDSTTGGYKLNYDLNDLIANGSVILQGSDVKNATATNQQNQTTGATEPVVSISLTDAGTKAFADATTTAYARGESIGIYYDGQFVSVPKVNAAITDGKCVIEGMSDFDEADSLASYIRIGGLNLELEELQSEVVGAQLGSSALSTSLLAAAIGLIIVMIFLMIMYRVPGVAASLALALYTGLMLFILWAFDITLTLPGIAGIILSIGMAVDANVIIFARVREEVTTGISVKTSLKNGFHKAMSAIVDGNVTTLIAAAILWFKGSGSVKGFAQTLALGIVVSMFTALVITRIIIFSLYAIGLRDVKFYAKKFKKERKIIDFLGKKAIFFAISIAVIAAGFVTMGVQSGKGEGALNYSLEFKGGTATTVTFDKDYSIKEIDSKIVPVVEDVTGDHNVQAQKVKDSNQIIIKTQTLNLDEREALNNALADKFGVDTSTITAENISSTVSSEMRQDAIIAVIISAICMLIYIWFRFKDVRFASSAVLALLHDLLFVLTFYALARTSVGNTFIACMLTILGYSINATIVIFDRIREELRVMKRNDDLKALVNRSITYTLTRSIYTTFTTFVMVAVLYIMGVSSIKEFAAPLMVGIAGGGYSSVCITGALWYVMKTKIGGKKAAKKK